MAQTELLVSLSLLSLFPLTPLPSPLSLTSTPSLPHPSNITHFIPLPSYGVGWGMETKYIHILCRASYTIIFRQLSRVFVVGPKSFRRLFPGKGVMMTMMTIMMMRVGMETWVHRGLRIFLLFGVINGFFSSSPLQSREMRKLLLDIA